MVVLLGKDSKGNTINDFENNETTEINTDVETSDDSISFQGFTINKQKCYENKIEEGVLTIYNDYFAVTLSGVISVSIEEIKLKQAAIINELINSGFNPANTKIAKYGDKEVMTIELTYEEDKWLEYYMAADNDHSFVGVILNSNNIINYDEVNTAVSLLSSAKNNGSYKAYSKDIKIAKYKNIFK